MKKVRLASLLFVAGILLLNPAIAEPSTCCWSFERHCEGVCEAHEGMAVTNCWGYYCTETCFCWDGYIDEHPGGSYCAPCED